jgi:Spy/CpxP family protein refolding chaperone
MKRLTWLFLFLCFAAFAFAQGAPAEPGPQGPPAGGEMHRGMEVHRGMGMGAGMGRGEGMGMGHDPLGEWLYPPDFILEHAQDINLTVEQKTAIRNEVKTTQGKFTDLQFQLQDETQAFIALLKQPKINEQQALGELDKVLDLERQVKRLHVGMAIRVKNTLSDEQLAKLKELHMRAMHMMMMRQGMEHPREGGPGHDGLPKRPQGEDE